MDFTRREMATIVMIIGIAMILIAVWLERRRKHQLMPSLVAPMPLKIFGAAVVLIAFVVVLLPNR